MNYWALEIQKYTRKKQDVDSACLNDISTWQKRKEEIFAKEKKQV